MRFTLAELGLTVAIAGLAVGVATMDRESAPSYQYLFDREKADSDQQRFMNTVIQHAGVTPQEMEPLMPELRSIWKDLPVIIYTAREAGRPLTEVVGLRTSGLGWAEVRQKLELPLKALFKDVPGSSETYKRAWTEWRMKFRPKITDQQIRELSLLQLAHQITGEPVEAIAKKHDRGTTPQTLIARHVVTPAADPAAAEAKADGKAPAAADGNAGKKPAASKTKPAASKSSRSGSSGR
jgi:hypothetical protein